MRLTPLAVIAVAVAASSMQTAAAQAGDDPAAPAIDLTIVNLGDGDGPVRIAVDTEATWFVKGAESIRTYTVDRAGEGVSLRIEGLAPGEYAIRVFHDEDGDGDLGTNFVGIPNEPYGFSGKKTDRMRPRSFDYARFSLDSDMTMTITLR